MNLEIPDVISALSLLVLSVYTGFTFGLLRQQKIQFERSNRPWVYVSDFSFDERLVLPDIGFIVLNTGRLPAKCTITVDNFLVTRPFDDKIQVHLGDVREFIVYPYVQGVETVHMFFLNLTEDQAALFTNNSRIECLLTVAYDVVGTKEAKLRHKYAAELIVEKLKVKGGRQATLTKVLSST